VLERQLIVYRRERSNIWQCRFKVDGKWQRASTKEYDLAKAKVAADRLRVKAEVRLENNLPVVTRRFKDVAKLAVDRMREMPAGARGQATVNDYIIVIDKYLIPFFGNRLVSSIDYAVLNEFEAWRITTMKKVPSQSTLLTHNAALNRVFDEAVTRGFLTPINKPKLDAKGKGTTGERRPAFTMEEVRAMFAAFGGWIERARDAAQKEARLLLRDYVTVLLDTGTRPGKELMNLKWKQISDAIKPIEQVTEARDEDGEPIVLTDLQRSVHFEVTGKTGTRPVIGNKAPFEALRNIAKRNYDQLVMPVLTPLMNVARPNNDDYVFRTKAKVDISQSFQKMFYSFLKEHNLQIDPITEQKRVFYSLRHTYATFQLTYDKTPVQTLADHMGTSVGMIEKHYNHLDILKAIEQLRGNETRRLMESSKATDEIYASTRVVEPFPVKKTTVKSKAAVG
jgi:integrase